VSGVNAVFAVGLIIASAVLVAGMLLMVFGIAGLGVASVRHTSEAVPSGLIDASFALIFGALAAGIAWALSWGLVLLSIDLFRDVVA
jgi:hypothetical protein